MYLQVGVYYDAHTTPLVVHFRGVGRGGWFEGLRTNPPFDRLISNTHFLQGLACMACHAPAPTTVFLTKRVEFMSLENF